MSKSPSKLEDFEDFSLTLGGPLYQLYLRTRIARPPLELLHRRMFVFAVLTWLPPLVLSAWAGTLFRSVDVPFLHDIVTHARFLVALPIFIVAERIVHQRIMPLVKEFVTRDLIPPAELPKFKAAVASALRMRNSVLIEVLILLICFSVGHFVWISKTSLRAATWYATATSSGLDLTLAGKWYAWVSMPIFQFIFFRWYFRLFIWTRFLWQVSRIPLRLMPAHPDRAGGLGFLGASVPALSPVLLAQGAVLAGLIAGKVFFEGGSLAAFKVDMIGFAVFQCVMILGPLCVFIPQLSAARRRGWGEYGTIAMHYVAAFDGKWNRAPAVSGEEMLGSGDIQSLADMENSYNVVSEMRMVPFRKQAVLQVIIASLLPVAPLVLTLIPIDQLITKLLGIPF